MDEATDVIDLVVKMMGGGQRETVRNKYWLCDQCGGEGKLVAARNRKYES